MSLSSFSEKFVLYLSHQKRYSTHTITAYQSDIASFLSFVQSTYQCEDILGITRFMVRDWLATFKMNDYATRSIVRKKNSIKSFFKYLLKEGVIKTDPTTALPTMKLEARLPQHASENEVQMLFENVTFPEGYEGSLHFTILHLLYLTGMRVSELTACTDDNIDSVRKHIKVLGKGNKERLIPLSDDTLDHLASYQDERNLAFPHSGVPQLFVSLKGKPITRQQVYLICHQYLALTTTLNKKSPHIFRHTFATHLLQNNAEINAIKELLGHSSLAATQIYTHTEMSKIKKAYKNAHPRSSLNDDKRAEKE